MKLVLLEEGKADFLIGSDRYALSAGTGREVYRMIEISGEHSLDDLCGAILSAYEFIDDIGSVWKRKIWRCLRRSPGTWYSPGKRD